MNRVHIVTGVIFFALGSLTVRAAEEERSELRQRAETYQGERARNPEFQPGEGRLTPPQRAEGPPKEKAQAKRASATQAKSGQDETRGKASKRVRSLKKIPGAFVRK